METSIHPEIIIVRRRGGHEDEHHGGAWKIAFADFMTAMMAFFLVLWIISATDKNTKAIIARYFNPVKLEESSRTPKSIRGDGSANPSLTAPGDKTDPELTIPGDANSELPPEGKNEAAKPANGVNKPDPSKSGASANLGDPASPKATMSEGVLFADPYRSLDVIAGPSSPNALAILQRDKADGAAPENEGLADPFRSLPGETAGPPPEARAPAATPPAPQDTPAPQETPEAKAPLTPPPAATQIPTPLAQIPPTPMAQTAAPQSAPAPAPNILKPTPADAERLQKALELQVGPLGGKQLGPAIEVKATDEGLLITLTDKLNFSMFAIGSAEPQPQVIKAMDAVAGILKTRPGAVIVRGHTDGHPYRSATYDNWRLSSARAQMAYYMLTRAGLPETRFDRIEGFADRRLRDPAHPFAAENRRIEILLKEDKP